MPRPDDIGKAYEDYYTGNDVGLPPRLRRFAKTLRDVRDSRLQAKLGYPSDHRLGRGSRLLTVAVLPAIPGLRDAVDDLACFLPRPQPSATLLEVGFGSGQRMRQMARLGWQVTGVDADPVAVERARKLGLEARLGDLRAQHFPDGYFHAVYNSHLLEHVHDPVGFLRECHRVLRPGGTLVTLTPNVSSLGHRRFGEAWFGLDPPRHLTLFSPTTLRTAVQRAGFSVVALRTSGRMAPIMWLASSEIVGSSTGVIPQPEPDRPLPLRDLLIALRATVMEAGMIAIGRPVGEELLLVASR